MMDWLKDMFGVNRYAVAWQWVSAGDFVHTGSTARWPTIGVLSKGAARRLAKTMNRSYGDGSHWIERVK